MADEDLRAVFRARRRGAARLSAQTVFSNRESEQASFWNALNDHRQWYRNEWSPVLREGDADDLSLPRRNVLVYYGVGGIGKTTLSSKLEELLQRDARERGATAATFRWDLGEAGALDFESFVFALRGAAGELGRSLPAFDLLLARYWALAHPGEEFQQHVARSSLLGRAAKAIKLSARVDEVLSDVGSSIASSSALFTAGADVARKAFGAISKSRLARQMCADCAYFEQLLNTEPDGEALAYMASILAWDIETTNRQDSVELVAFVDTYEMVSDDAQRRFERLFQRVVFLTPNVLWIVTGRNRVDWNDESLDGVLDYVGDDCWPLLSGTGHAWQHLVGFLSDRDASGYLENRVVIQGKPAIPEELRAAIVDAARGLPLHLDLAVMRYMRLARTDGEVDVGEFQTTFAVLVDRIMRDLDEHECRLLEATSLLDHFDRELAVVAAGDGTMDADFERFVQRPFVVRASSSLWPYRIHDAVRSCVNEHADTAHGRWSRREREASARRSFEHIGRVMAPAIVTRDRPRLLAGLTQGLSVAIRHDLSVGWLEDAAFALHESSSWQTVLPDWLADSDIDTDARALAVGLAVVSRRRTAQRAWIIERLDDVLDRGVLDGDLADLFVRYRSHALRRMGRHDEALAGYQAIAERGGRLASEAEWNIVRYREAMGQFRTALAPYTDRRDLRAGLERVLGNVLKDNALFVEAEAHYIRAADAAEHAREEGRRALCLSDLVLARAWQNLSIERDVERACSAAEGTGRRQPYQQVALARVIVAAGRETARFEAYLDEYRGRSRRARMVENEIFAVVAEALHAAVRADRAGMVSAGAQVRELGDELRAYCFWSDVIDWWNGKDEPDPNRYEWLGGRDAARRRWAAVVDRRRQ
jgi:hypothetical protein